MGGGLGRAAKRDLIRAGVGSGVGGTDGREGHAWVGAVGGWGLNAADVESRVGYGVRVGS